MKNLGYSHSFDSMNLKVKKSIFRQILKSKANNQ